MEILLAMGAAFIVFLLFFLVFTIKRREGGEPVRIHTCQNCGCGKESEHLDRFRRQAGKPAGCLNRRDAGAEVEPGSGGKGS